MCGIAGIYHYGHGRGEDLRALHAMVSAMTHRGPDAKGTYHKGRCALGHRRLAIIDLDARANQPFTDHTGRYTVVFNGQIYNFREIKAELQDYPYHTTSDTEVIVAAFSKWKEQCLQRMNGMFAFAIYDATEDTLFLARDRMGVKPLYYYKDDSVFLFASEIRTVLTSGLVSKKRLDNKALQEFLLFQAPVSPKTIVEGISQLPPGHYAFLDSEGLRISEYWSIKPHRLNSEVDEAQVVTDVRQLLYNSVERRLISDVPLGAFLSGGIDSSVIVAIMSQIESPVNTFSIVFNEKDYDESAFSDIIAKKYATRHHKLLLPPGQFLNELPDALAAMDSPSADGMNTYIVSKLTRQSGVTVAMSGLGGDELFAGYPNFRVWNDLVRSGFFKLPKPFRKVIAKAWGARRSLPHRRRIHALAASDGDITEVYPVFRQAMLQNMAQDLVRPHIQIQNDPENVAIENGLSPEYSVSQYSIAELTHYTRNVLLKDTDQFSMASSLEVREPFFDYLLVEYVLQLPDKWKLGKAPKTLLVSAMNDLLPDEIIYRRKKGFMFPWDTWIRNELSHIADSNIEYLCDQQILNPAAVRQLYSDFNARSREVNWTHIWQMIVLGSWMRTNIEGEDKANLC